MPLQTFSQLQDSTRLIRYQDTLYKVKIVFAKLLKEKGVHIAQISEEIEATLKAILYLLEHNSDLKTIATPNSFIIPKLVPWALPKKNKECVFMQNGKVLKAFDHMFELHINDKSVKHLKDIDQTCGVKVNQSHVNKSFDEGKKSVGGKNAISCYEQKSNSYSDIEKADNTGKVYVQTMINLDNSELEAIPKFERTKDGRLCRIIRSNCLVEHVNETRQINNQVTNSVNPSLTERKGQLSKKLILKPREKNMLLSVKRELDLMNSSDKTSEPVESKKRKHAFKSNMNAANYKLHEKNLSSPYILRENTVNDFKTACKQDFAVEPTSYQMSLELHKQALTNIANDRKNTRKEDEVKCNPPRKPKNYLRNDKRQKEKAVKSNFTAETQNYKACKERVNNLELNGKKNVSSKSVGISTRSSRKTGHQQMTDSNCNTNEQSLSLESETEPNRKKTRLSPGLTYQRSQENDIHIKNEIDCSSSPRRILNGQNYNRNNSAVCLRSSITEDGHLKAHQKEQEVCSPRISAVHPTRRANSFMPKTVSVQDSMSRPNNSNTPLISSTRMTRQDPGHDAESLRIEQMRENWPTHIIVSVSSHGRDRYIVEQAERAETEKLRQLYEPVMPRRSLRMIPKNSYTWKHRNSGLCGRIVDTFVTPMKKLINWK